MRAKKHFGQHFLTNPDTALRIVEGLGPLEELDVLEIGPGMGIITQFMVNHCKRFRAVEIDPEAQEYLEKTFENIELIKADFLKVNLLAYMEGQFSLIGNFPYNISSQIVFKILDHYDRIPRWVGMFQLEMGERLYATPQDKKAYGILSVLLPFYYKVERMMVLPPGAFNPPPKVNSIVLVADRVDYTMKCSPKTLRRVVKTAFGQRRKTLANSLSSIVPKSVIIQHQFATLRPENLTHLQFEELTLFLEDHVSS